MSRQRKSCTGSTKFPFAKNVQPEWEDAAMALKVLLAISAAEGKIAMAAAVVNIDCSDLPDDVCLTDANLECAAAAAPAVLYMRRPESSYPLQ